MSLTCHNALIQVRRRDGRRLRHQRVAVELPSCARRVTRRVHVAVSVCGRSTRCLLPRADRETSSNRVSFKVCLFEACNRMCSAYCSLPPTHKLTHPHSHSHTHAHTRAHTHTHTHRETCICIHARSHTQLQTHARARLLLAQRVRRVVHGGATTSATARQRGQAVRGLRQR